MTVLQLSCCSRFSYRSELAAFSKGMTYSSLFLMKLHYWTKAQNDENILRDGKLNPCFEAKAVFFWRFPLGLMLSGAVSFQGAFITDILVFGLSASFLVITRTVSVAHLYVNITPINHLGKCHI